MAVAKGRAARFCLVSGLLRMRVKYAVSPSSNAPFFEQVHRRAMEVESLKHEVESKNAEIDSQRKQLEVQRDKIEQQSKEIEALKSENALLREQLEKQSIPFPEPATTEVRYKCFPVSECCHS